MTRSFSFDQNQFDRMFPFYVLIDKDLRILSIGKSLAKVYPIEVGKLFNQSFRIPRPFTDVKSFDDLLKLQNQLIALKSKSNKELILRGQFEFFQDKGQILFVGSPWFNSMNQIRENELVINDFANHDPLVDLLLVLKSIELTNEDLKELIATSDKQKDELKRINKKARDIALFTEQNPDPILRIDYNGELLQNNPAASQLDFIQYKGKKYRNDEFFKLLVADIQSKPSRWVVDCRSNNIDYSFTCVSMPSEGYVHFYGTDITKQKESQEELNKLSLIIQKTVNAVIIADNEGKIEWVNKGFETMTGYTLLEVKGKTPGSFLQGKNTDPETVAYMREKIRNSETFTCEILNYRKSGEEYWIRINAQPIFDNKGNPIQFFAIEEDITFEKQAQEKLDKQRIFYEQILDNIPADIAVLDSTQKYLYINPKAIDDEKLRNWLIGKRIDDFIKTNSEFKLLLQNRKKKFDEVIKSKELNSWEEKLIHEDGNNKYLMGNFYPVLGVENEVELVIGYGADITNIKNIQKQIELSEKKYRDVIDNSLAVVTTHDLDGRFLTVNPVVSKLFGYKNEEIIGRPLTDFLPDKDKLLFNDNYLNKIKQVKEATGIFRVIHKDGNIVYTLYNNFLKEEVGEKPYVIGFAVDITSRILAEKELKIAKKVTEDLVEAKQNFLANMSHEIRTPLNAIMGMSRQLQKSTLSKEQNSYLDTIKNSSENLLVIVNDVLDLSKIEAGKLSIENIGFEMNILLDKVIGGMKYRAKDKGLQLAISYIDPRVSQVLIGDPHRITQILLNLISNSIKFTNHGGVDISCVLIEEDLKSQTIDIKVTDTGIGMDSSFVKSLFNKFSQEDESISRRFGGTGLGMSITKSLVDVMDGEIEVVSEKNMGTEVTLTLTLKKGKIEDIKSKDKERINYNILKGKKILVVDDNEINRLIAATILKDFGVVSVEVEDGEEAVNSFGKNDFDLILMDIQMPRLNGYETTKIIRKEFKSHIPIIALTANVIKGESEKCKKAGMNDYLSKPFEEEQLLHVVSKWLEKSISVAKDDEGVKNENTLFDLKKLEEISSGNINFVNKMVKLFIDKIPKEISEIKLAYKEGNYHKISVIAHKIKPSIDIMGIVALKKEIRDIEKNANIYKSSEKLEKLISKLDYTLGEVVNDLKQKTLN